MLKVVSSKENQAFKSALKLINDSEHITIEGFKIFNEAINSGFEPEVVLVTQKAFCHLSEFYKKKCTILSDRLLKKISDVKTSQGIVASIKKASDSNLCKIAMNASLLVILDQVQDPGNLGTILRTSEAMGADALITTKGSCRLNSKAVRASAGSFLRIPVFENFVPEVIIEILRSNGYNLIVTQMDGKTLYDFSFGGKCALIFGQEGSGVSKAFHETADHRVAVPINQSVQSLNVAVTAAMCLYEWAKQKCLQVPADYKEIKCSNLTKKY